ncbi:hypothetical protein [Streptomyces sp. KL116D]|uniref:hypothetical protein n=1 Tax=Streptomyces sp. KL116D TaxID=3045152 RepID=UPI003556E630
MSIQHGLRGPSGVVVSEQAGGLDAVAQARRRLRGGVRADAHSGGFDSALCLGLDRAARRGRHERARRRPPRLSAVRRRRVGARGRRGRRPASSWRDADAARARGTAVLGTVEGLRRPLDPAPGTGAPRLLAAARLALADARIEPADVDVVFCRRGGRPGRRPGRGHGARRAVRPRTGVAVTAPKSLTGRLGSGGSALDLAAALCALRDQVVPPTTGAVRVADDCPRGPGHRRPAPGPAAPRPGPGQGARRFNAATVVRAALTAPTTRPPMTSYDPPKIRQPRNEEHHGRLELTELAVLLRGPRAATGDRPGREHPGRLVPRPGLRLPGPAAGSSRGRRARPRRDARRRRWPTRRRRASTSTSSTRAGQRAPRLNRGRGAFGPAPAKGPVPQVADGVHAYDAARRRLGA